MNRQILMVANLEEFSLSGQLEAPRSYCWRTYEQGYERHWNDVQNTVFQSKKRDFTEKYVNRSRTVFLPDHFFFVFWNRNSGRQTLPVGINTAEIVKVNGAYLANLDYCGVLPDHRGKGLGTLLVALVMQCFKNDGFSRATLRTPDTDERKAAIKLYSDMGWYVDKRDDPVAIRERQLKFAETPNLP